MTATAYSELREASDETIEDAVAHADPMVLRGLLHQLTGDTSLVDLPLVTAPFGHLEARVPSNPEDVASLRARATALLKTYRDHGTASPEIGPPERLARSLSLTAGEELAESELEMWIEQSALDPWARGLSWEHAPSPQRLEGFTVAIIGAGVGGLNAAVLLGRAGIP